MDALRDIGDPAIEARAYTVIADYYEMSGEFDRAHTKY
jgi:hypothetical protein